MKYCSGCNEYYDSSFSFCPDCGRPLEASADETAYIPTHGENTGFYGETAGRAPVPQSNTAERNIPVLDRINRLMQSSFVKGVISAACSLFPAASIVGIIFGALSISSRKKAMRLALSEGVHTSRVSKRIPARILGITGLILSIVMTVLYVLYFFIFVMMFSLNKYAF